MVAIAILGVLFNAFSIKILGHSHDHHDHEHEHSHNQSMFSLHLWEDLLGWVAVLIGGLVIWKTGWAWVDPLLSIGISLFILKFAYRSLKGVQSILTQAYPPGFEPTKCIELLMKIEGVEGVHDLHAWSLDGSKHVASLHVVYGKNYSEEQIKKSVRRVFSDTGKFHVTVETELSSESCGSP
jgi:cobalt-zinc-cadmium efflux system protein